MQESHDMPDALPKQSYVSLISIAVAVPSIAVWNIMLKVRQWLGGE